MQKNEKELFYEADTRQHQQWVAEKLMRCAQRLLSRAITHDMSKFDPVELESYVNPVWELNTRNVEYGSDEYIRLTKSMRDGWKNHVLNNSHHPEHYEEGLQEGESPFDKMDLFDLLEMCCDWIGASQRKNNDPLLPLSRFQEKKGMTPQLAAILTKTVNGLRGTGY